MEGQRRVDLQTPHRTAPLPRGRPRQVAAEKAGQGGCCNGKGEHA